MGQFSVFLKKNIWISIIISLKLIPKVPIDNTPSLVQVMSWRRTGHKPLSEPIVAEFTDAYICHSALMS